MDIASVEFLSSRSIEAFADHPHVLDGSLGRTLAYLALAIVLGLRLWMSNIRNSAPTRLIPYQLTALIAGFAGAFLVIHAALAEAVDPFSSPFSMQASSVTLADYRQLLLHTTYGKAWLAYGALLTAGGAFIRYPWVAWLAGIGAAFALAACGHSGEYGLDTPLYWFGVVHLLQALTWIGGLVVLVAGRWGSGWRADYVALQSFSRLALLLFVLIILAGMVRLGLQYWYEQGLGPVYVAILLLKLIAVTGVVISAAGLRKTLREQAAPEGRDDPKQNRYDQKLGNEVFFAALLILSTALLTQLPPR